MEKFVTESSQTSFLNCFYTNATSIDSPRKMGLLLAELANQNHPNLVFIAETWFNEESANLIIGMYSCARRYK